MNIRKARREDISDIMRIIKCAKAYMRETGNATQWQGSYPDEDVFFEDIDAGCCYVCVNSDSGAQGESREGDDSGDSSEKICAVFSFVIGDDPTYAVIENGAWKLNTPYGTIHRIASDGSCKGVFRVCFDFAKEKISHLRADTHENNKTMQHVLEKNGFEKCGIIYEPDGSPRLAYEFSPVGR